MLSCGAAGRGCWGGGRGETGLWGLMKAPSWSLGESRRVMLVSKGGGGRIVRMQQA